MRRKRNPDGKARRGEAGEGQEGTAAPGDSEADADGPLPSTALPLREDAAALTVVGLGGSAGSIAAMQAFFENVSPDPGGSAYVVVLHLSADYESHLPQVLGRSTSLPVHQVTEAVRIEANHVYVIPPGKDLAMRDGTLHLSNLERTPGRRVVIDTFFRTLAAAHGPQAAAVVFSGTGADGALGIRQIKESGGLVVAQSPSEAEYDAMPRSAIATGLVDYVLPVTAMPAQIAAYWETSRRMRVPGEAAPSPEQREEGPAQESALQDILTHVRAQTGHDFAFYKRATALRRIGRRMQVNGLQTLPDYRDFLRSHPAEVGGLIGDLLISVTQFFRDPDAWATLERDVVPRLFAGKTGDEAEIRAWVCGCATGEEAYTLAILLLEGAERMPRPPRVQVFATDMDADAIARARAGVYPETIAGDLSEERLRRWFYRQNGSYQVRKEVREVVLFAHHDVLRDTPFSRLDLVTCRNLLIYLNREAQERIFRTFHFALRPDGPLLLGPSESVEGTEGLFLAANKGHRLFTRRAVPRSALPPLPTPLFLPDLSRWSEASEGVIGRVESPRSNQAPPGSGEGGSPFTTPPPLFSSRTGASSGGNVSRDLLPRYGPPVAVVNEDYTIAHLSGSVSDFLRLPEGEPTFNLLDLIHPDLRPELRGALFGAAQEGVEQIRVVRSAVHEGRENAIRLSVRPVPSSPAADAPGYFVVQFEELSEAFLTALRPFLSEGPLGESASAGPGAGAAPDPASVNAANASAEVARRLAQENAALQRDLRIASEQYDAVTEELKASNEEMQATNEEMRSVVEELETGKEELQSVNEELSTVNYELKARVEELTATNSDLANFLGATDIATLFLDRVLNIKRFTSATLALFNLIPTDIGRPLAHITNRLNYPALEEDAEAVLSRLIPVEREVTSTDGQRHFLVRLLPYRSLDDRIEGVVVSFVDITARKRAEEGVRQSEARQAFLIRLGDGLRPLTDPNEIRSTAMRLMGSHLGVNRATYVDAEREPDTMRVISDYTWGVQPWVGRINLSDFGAALGKDFAEGKTVAIADVQADVRFADSRDTYAALEIGAAVGVPLLKDGQIVAAMGVHNKAPRQWTPDEITLIEEVAERTWATVERARAEEVLRESERRLQRMVNVPRVGVLTFDFSGAILGANDAFLEMVGYTRDEFTARGFTWLDLTPPEYAEASEGVMENLRTTGRGGPYEKEYIRKDGSRIWFMFVAATLGDGTIVEYAIDISDRKHAEGALRESEEQYRALFESMDQGFCTIEVLFDEGGKAADYRFLEANPAFARQAGFENAVGKRMREIAPQLEEFWFETYGRVARTGEGTRFEHEAAALGRFHDVYAFRIGRPQENRVAILFNDITARKRAEAHLAFLANLMADFAPFLTAGEIMERIGGRLARHLGLSHCSFATVDKEDDHITTLYDWRGDAEALSLLGNNRISAFLTESGKRRYSAGEMIVIRDIRNDPVVNAPPELLDRLRIGSVIDAPYLENGEWKFMVSVARAEPSDWRPDEIELVREVTTRIYIRLERARAEEALRESEARFRLLVEGAREYAMFLLDTEGDITFWSAGAERVFGYSEAEALGMSAAVLFTPDDRRAGEPEKETRTALAEGRASDQRWHVRRDGSRFWADGILMRLDDDAGRLRGFAKVARDATEQKRAEDAIEAALKAVAVANAELERRVEERTRQLSEMSQMRQELLRQLVLAQEQERSRISRDMHDDTGQQVTALLLGLNFLSGRPGLAGDADAEAHLAKLMDLAGEMGKKSHRLAFTLRPTDLDDIGLLGALDNYTAEWSRWTGLPVEVVGVGLEGQSGKAARLPAEIETTI